MNDPVEILLAVYNGQAYLPELLESLKQQTYPNWTLTVRDDGSTDQSRLIISDFADRNPGKVKTIDDERNNLGPNLNFAVLLEQSSAPYVMCCDQDDVWLPEKMEQTLEKMKTAEAFYPPETPILVHTDLTIVDENLNPVAQSMWRYQKLLPAIANDPYRLLAQNVVTGCTAMLNRPAVEAGTPVSPDAIMFDWWIALQTSRRGKIIAIDKPTILYRQHGKNAIGAKRYHPFNPFSFLKKSLSLSQKLRKHLKMARAFDPEITLSRLIRLKAAAKIRQRFAAFPRHSKR